MRIQFIYIFIYLTHNVVGFVGELEHGEVPAPDVLHQVPLVVPEVNLRLLELLPQLLALCLGDFPFLEALPHFYSGHRQYPLFVLKLYVNEQIRFYEKKSEII